MSARTLLSYVVLPIGLIVLAVAMPIEAFKHFGGTKDWVFKHWDVLIGALIL
jgi:hypothetical protein